MLYLSQVLGRSILDHDGERVATIKDVIVRLGEEDHPPVTGFVARYRRRDFFLPAADETRWHQASPQSLQAHVRARNAKLAARFNQLHIVDAHDALTVHVNQLLIQNVARQQDFALAPRKRAKVQNV